MMVSAQALHVAVPVEAAAASWWPLRTQAEVAAAAPIKKPWALSPWNGSVRLASSVLNSTSRLEGSTPLGLQGRHGSLQTTPAFPRAG